MWVDLWTISDITRGLVAFNNKEALTPAIQTSKPGTISWLTCPDVNSTQCAFLDVPMDYDNLYSNPTVSIFLRKYPATAPIEQRLGSLLINPGGPGGSGGTAIVGMGEPLSTIVDGKYDIIGFDPRAVNLTGPSTACHDVEYKFAERAYQVNMHGAPFPHVGEAGETAHVAKLAAIQSSHHIACVHNGNHEMLRNSGTVAVARDMERIVEALGEDGLNYIGYSYGTILGATFAAIRPNLVKRMVLDGVANAESYFNDILQFGKDALQDTHKALDGFIATCIDAGPSQCALAAAKDNKTDTVQGLAKQLNALYTQLGKEPLVIGDSATGPGIIQANNARLLVFGSLYSPSSWPQLAQVLALLKQGDGREYYPVLTNITYGAVPEPYTQNAFNRSMNRFPGTTREPQYPILCSDSPQLDITVKQYAEYFREMGKSPMGEQLALILGGCRGWPFRAKRYVGPWTVEGGLKKTRFPILFVSLDADPVTPLASAVKMSRGFGNESASLLIQQGFGHTSLAHPSLCTINNIRGYLLDGKVPKNGTHCTPEPGWIYPTNSTGSKQSTLTKWDRDLLSAVEKLSRSRTPIFL